MDRLTLELLAMHHPTAAVVFVSWTTFGQSWECAKCALDYVSGAVDSKFAEVVIRRSHIATLEEFATKPAPRCGVCGCYTDRVTDYDQWRDA